MEKIKILYILTKSGIGGAQKYVSDLAENLGKNKFEAKEITEDDKFLFEKKLQEITDEFVGKIEEMGGKKKAELLQI